MTTSPGGLPAAGQLQPAAEPDQDRRRDRQVKWATVLATTIDAAARIAEIITRH
jgi:hypothetical protein